LLLVKAASIFCTPIHTFAQPYLQIFIDALRQKIYLPRQIEPEA